MKVHTIPLNPWQVNTYILSDESGECVIIDPGCFSDEEKEHLTRFISDNNLKPVRLLHTHLHLDHVFGTRFVSETYGLKPEAHPDDEFFIGITKDYASQFGVTLEENPPALGNYLNEGDEIKFGSSELKVIHIPGHSPGGITFYNSKEGILIAGDVLFKESIGRTDLPGGDYDTLISSIKNKLLTLPEDTVVFPGHGPSTSIGYEKGSNPFLK